jgi:hypothetical protein
LDWGTGFIRSIYEIKKEEMWEIEYANMSNNLQPEFGTAPAAE